MSINYVSYNEGFQFQVVKYLEILEMEPEMGWFGKWMDFNEV